MTYHDPKRFPSFDVVAYHANCTDGLAAAAVVLLALDHTHCGKFVPVQYGQPLPEAIANGGENIIFVDFCPELEQIPAIQQAWKDWFVLDHHLSREWVGVDYPNNSVFAMEASGAVLAWEWFNRGQACPEMLSYVQDRDLWEWKLPDSRAVSAALAEQDRDVDRFARLITEFNVADFIAKGEILLTSRARSAKSKAEKAFLTQTLCGIPFRAVNATENMSEVGEEILAAFPDVEIACAFFQIGTDTMQLSFRSRSHQPGSLTALDAAKALGGGGHRHAAGAKMDLRDWAPFLRGEVVVKSHS